MIKKNTLKIGLLSFAVGILTLVVGVQGARADALSFTSTNLTVNGITLNIQDNSTATQIAVGATTLVATIPAGSRFVVISPDRYSLANDMGAVQTCTNSSNTVTIEPVGTAQTVTISPTTTVCSNAGGMGLSSGGSTGGSTSSSSGSSTSSSSSSSSSSTTTTTGSGSAPVTVTVSPTVTMSTVIEGCTGTTGFSTVNGMSCAGNMMPTTTVTTTSGATVTYNFGTVTLKNGSKGEAVMELQRFLNKTLNLGLVVDGKLGPKTIAVIKKWQKDHNLVADGLIGAKTKAMMNASIQ